MSWQAHSTCLFLLFICYYKISPSLQTNDSTTVLQCINQSLWDYNHICNLGNWVDYCNPTQSLNSGPRFTVKYIKVLVVSNILNEIQEKLIISTKKNKKEPYTWKSLALRLVLMGLKRIFMEYLDKYWNQLCSSLVTEFLCSYLDLLKDTDEDEYNIFCGQEMKT